MAPAAYLAVVFKLRRLSMVTKNERHRQNPRARLLLEAGLLRLMLIAVVVIC